MRRKGPVCRDALSRGRDLIMVSDKAEDKLAGAKERTKFQVRGWLIESRQECQRRERPLVTGHAGSSEVGVMRIPQILLLPSRRHGKAKISAGYEDQSWDENQGFASTVLRFPLRCSFALLASEGLLPTAALERGDLQRHASRVERPFHPVGEDGEERVSSNIVVRIVPGHAAANLRWLATGGKRLAQVASTWYDLLLAVSFPRGYRDTGPCAQTFLLGGLAGEM